MFFWSDALAYIGDVHVVVMFSVLFKCFHKGNCPMSSV